MASLPIYPGTPLPAPSTTQVVNRPDSTPVSQRSQEIDNTRFRRQLDSHFRPEGLTFSRHAQKRLEMRGISFTPDGLSRIEEAVNKAASKGSRDALVVAGKLSLVVSVDNRTVVTVMNQEDMQENLVTNIDSAVFA